jgi:hypothetical protein
VTVFPETAGLIEPVVVIVSPFVIVEEEVVQDTEEAIFLTVIDTVLLIDPL